MNKWRFFELKNGELHTLFHSVGASGRRIEKGKWLRARQGIVRDGRGRYYRGGFHVFDSVEIAMEFIKKFRAARTIVAVPVQVRGRIRKKPTNNRILLAEFMRVPRKPYIVTMKEGN